jgi:hypothetical protein
VADQEPGAVTAAEAGLAVEGFDHLHQGRMQFRANKTVNLINGGLPVAYALLPT